MPLATTYCPVGCDCHTSPYTPCSEPGGCGSTGCTPTVGTCPACRKRDPEHGYVCEPCRRWLPTALNSLPELAGRLADELLPLDDTTTLPVLVCRTCGETRPYTADRRHARHRNPAHDRSPTGQWHGSEWDRQTLIHHAGGPAPSLPTNTIINTAAPTEATAPINLHIHDLLADVVRDGGRPIDITGDNWIRASRLEPVAVNHTRFEITERREEHENPDGTIAVTFHRDFRHATQQLTVMDRRSRLDGNGRPVMIPAGDQIGVISIAQTLDQEVRAWIDHGAPGGHHRPTPTINHLVDWLTKRLNWACDNYPAIDTLTDALTDLRGQAMNALGDFDPQAELCDGIDCPRCGLRMLFRRQDGTGDVECQNPDCRRVLTAADYHEHVKTAAKQARTRH